RDAAELQLGRRRAGALLDELERELLGLLVLLLIQHFETVDDRADRADQVVANTRAQQRGEIESFDRAGHGRVSGGKAQCRRAGESLFRQLLRVIHRTRATAKDRSETLTARHEISPAMAADLLDGLTAIVAQASAVILANPYTDHRLKDDQSPVTPADEAAEAAILEGLARVLPGVPVVSEEGAGHGAPPKADESFVLVDPLDGTRQFIEGLPEYTVNVAIVTKRTPIAGIVAAPAYGLLWRGVTGVRAERMRLGPNGVEKPEQIRTRRWPDKDAVASVSRSHYDPDTDALLKKLGPMQRDHSGSSIKFCRIAEGSA